MDTVCVITEEDMHTRNVDWSVRLLVIAVIALGLMMACAAPAPQPAAPQEEAAAPTAEVMPVEEEPPVEEEAAALVVGVQVPTLANPFWVNYMDFMQQVAGELNIELKVSDVQNREDKQISDLESLIAAGVDGLVLVPQTAEVGPTLLRNAEEASIPVVIPDRWPGVEPGDPEYSQYVAFIGPNDFDAGYNICQALVDAGSTKLVAVSGFHGASVHEGRSDGMNQCVEDNGIELLAEEWVGETREKGLQTMENYLSRFPGPEFDGAWHLNDDTAMGSIQALEAAGFLEDVHVAGMDLNPDAVQALQEGKYTYSTGGHWLQGGFGLIMLYDWINGIEPTERVVRLDLLGVTPETVDVFVDQYIENPPQYDIQSMSRFHNPDAQTYFEISLEE